MEKVDPEIESVSHCRRETIQNASSPQLYGGIGLDGISNLDVDENIAASVFSKNHQQGRIISTVSSPYDTSESGELGYSGSSFFTIRGYVSCMRQKSIRKNWPFSERSFKQHHDKAEGPLLPPFEPRPLYCPTSEVGLGQKYAIETVINGISRNNSIFSHEVTLHLELDGGKAKEDGAPHEALMTLQSGLEIEEIKQLADINGQKTDMRAGYYDVSLTQNEETFQMPKEVTYCDSIMEENSVKRGGETQHRLERQYDEVLLDTISPTIELDPEADRAGGQLEELESQTNSIFVSEKKNDCLGNPCDEMESPSQQTPGSKSIAMVVTVEENKGGLSKTHNCRNGCKECESNIDLFSQNSPPSWNILNMKINVDLTCHKNASRTEPHPDEIEQKLPKQKGKIQKTRLITDIISSHPALVQEVKHFSERQPLKAFIEKTGTRCPLSNQQHAIYRKKVASTKLARARRLKYGISRKDSFVHSKREPGKRKHHRLDADKFHSTSEHPSKRNCLEGEHPFRKEVVQTRNRKIRSTFNLSSSIAHCAEVSPNYHCMMSGDHDHRAYVDKGLALNSNLSAERDYENLGITEEHHQSEHRGGEQSDVCVDPLLRLDSPLDPAILTQLKACEDLCVPALGKRNQPSPKLNVAWWPPVAMVRKMVDSVQNMNSTGTVERTSRCPEVQPVCLANTECEMTDRSTSSLESSQIVLETNESLEVSDSESMQYRDQSEQPPLEIAENRSKEYFEVAHFQSDQAQARDISLKTIRQTNGKDTLSASNIEYQKVNASLSSLEKDFNSQSKINAKLVNIHEPSVQVQKDLQTNPSREEQSSIIGRFQVDTSQSFIGQAEQVGNISIGPSCQTTPEQRCASRTKEAWEDFQGRSFRKAVNLQSSSNTALVQCSPHCLPHHINKKPSDTCTSDARVDDLCISTEQVEIAEQDIGLKNVACKVLHAPVYGAVIPLNEPVMPILKSNRPLEHEKNTNKPKLSWKAAVVMATMGAHLGVNFAGLLSNQPNSSTVYLPPQATSSKGNCDGAGVKSTTVGCAATDMLLIDRSSYVPSDQSARDLANGTRLNSENSARICTPAIPSCSSVQDTRTTGSAVNNLTVPQTTITLPSISSGKECIAAPKSLDQTPKSRLSASNISVAVGDRVLRTFPRGLPPGRYSVNADGARCLEISKKGRMQTPYNAHGQVGRKTDGSSAGNKLILIDSEPDVSQKQEGSKLKVVTSEAISEKDISATEFAVLSLSETSKLQQKNKFQGLKSVGKNLVSEKVSNADLRNSLGQGKVSDCSTMDLTDSSNMGKPMLRLMGTNVLLSSRCTNEQEQYWQHQKQQNGVECAVSGHEGALQSIEYALTPAMNDSLQDADNASLNSRVHSLFVPGSSQLSNCTIFPGNNTPDVSKVPHFSFQRQEQVEVVRFDTCSELKLPSLSVQEQRDSLARTHIQGISGNNLQSEREADNLIVNNTQTCRSQAISASNLFPVRRNNSTVLKQKVSPSIETFAAESCRGSEKESSILDVGLVIPVTTATDNVGLSVLKKVSSVSPLNTPSRMKSFPPSDTLLSAPKAGKSVTQPSENHCQQNMQFPPRVFYSRKQKEAYLAANVIEIEDDDELEPSIGFASNSHNEQLRNQELGLQTSLSSLKHVETQKISNKVNQRFDSCQVDYLPITDLSSPLVGVAALNCRNSSMSVSDIQNMRISDADQRTFYVGGQDQPNADASNQEKTKRKRCAGKIKLARNSDLKWQQESLSKWKRNTTSSKGFPGPPLPNWISGINAGIKRGATANFFKARVEMMKSGRPTQNLAQFPSGRLTATDTSNMANACHADHHKASGSGNLSYLPISVPQSNADYYDFLSSNSVKDSALNDLIRVPSQILEARNPFVGTCKSNFICQEQLLVPSLSVAESLQKRSRQILMSQRPSSDIVRRIAPNQLNSNLLQRSELHYAPGLDIFGAEYDQRRLRTSTNNINDLQMIAGALDNVGQIGSSQLNSNLLQRSEVHYAPGSDVLGTEYHQRRLPTSNNNINDLQMIAGALDYPFSKLAPSNLDMFHTKPLLVQKYQDRSLQRVGETRNSESLTKEMCPLGFAASDQLLAYQLQRTGNDYGKHSTADYSQQRKKVKRNNTFRPIPPVP